MRKLALFLSIASLICAAASLRGQDAVSGGKSAAKSPASQASPMRAKYQAEAESKLHQLDRQIAELEAKSARQTQAARKRFAPQLKQLRQKRDVAQEELEKLKNSSQEAWRAMKPDLDAAMKNLEDAYRHAASKFKS